LFVALAQNILLAQARSAVRPAIGSLLVVLRAARIQPTKAERGGIVRRKLEELGADRS
jgi:hypothetical protein